MAVQQFEGLPVDSCWFALLHLDSALLTLLSGGATVVTTFISASNLNLCCKSYPKKTNTFKRLLQKIARGDCLEHLSRWMFSLDPSVMIPDPHVISHVALWLLLNVDFDANDSIPRTDA